MNLPAVLVALSVMGKLLAGTRKSASLNIVLVIIKLTALVFFFVVSALPALQLRHFEPFMPYGFASTGVNGHQHGVMAAAAIVFLPFMASMPSRHPPKSRRIPGAT